MTTSALYFTRHVGFTAGEVALALSVAAMVGHGRPGPGGAPGRHPRARGEMLIRFLTGSALLSATPVFARTPWMLALLLGLLAVFESSAGAVRQGVIAPARDRLAAGCCSRPTSAPSPTPRSASGSLLGGAALVVDEPWAYIAVFAVNAVFTGRGRRSPPPGCPTCRRTSGRRASPAWRSCGTGRSW